MMMMMANQEEKPVTSSSSTLVAEPDNIVDDQDYEDTAVMPRVCCGCFKGSMFWKRNNSGSNGYLLPKQEEKKGNCFREKAKKIKEISEILAGPKWKNLIRRFSIGHGFISSKKRRMQCHYDPQSYAMNFDDGIDREADVSFPDFLARYAAAAPVGMSKG